jgi:hypothetical protein
MPAPSAGDRSFCRDASGTYKRNNTYMSNLRSLGDALIGDAARLLSATGAAGEGPDRVYGTMLCRGDSTGPDCSRRLREALGTVYGNATGACALHRDVAIYSELYQLRFSNQGFLSNFSNSPEWVDITNPDTVPHAAATRFDELVTELLGALADAAARRPDRFAAGDAPWSWSREKEQTVYGLAQCTRDMPPELCRSCLEGILTERRQTIGGAVFGARCTLRYEMDLQFFNNTGNSKMLSLRKFLLKHDQLKCESIYFVFVPVMCYYKGSVLQSLPACFFYRSQQGRSLPIFFVLKYGMKYVLHGTKPKKDPSIETLDYSTNTF